jgi:hypothetical protein
MKRWNLSLSLLLLLMFCSVFFMPGTGIAADKKEIVLGTPLPIKATFYEGMEQKGHTKRK